MKKNNYKTLQKIYNDYLTNYKRTGIKPYPDKLLALLILPEKDNYEPLMTSEGKFYDAYKKEIDEKIEQVINDFNLTKEDIIRFIEQKDICYVEEDYEEDKIWFVFAEGFGAMHWSLMYHPEYTPEQVYLECYDTFHKQSSKNISQPKVKQLTKHQKRVENRNGH